MTNGIKVLMIGAECAPFIKIGGLADVMGTLPGELKALGADVRVMMPMHKRIKDEYFSQTTHITDFYLPVGDHAFYVGIEKLERDGVIYYFVDNEDMFGGPVYKGGEPEGEQYAFFCMAICESLDRIDFVPDIVHGNDWQVGMVGEILHKLYAYRPQGKCKFLYTIHNMQYQGVFSKGLMGYWFHLRDFNGNEEYSFVKSALANADWVSTVSPTYAKEITTKEMGCSLENDVSAISDRLSGIVNGINTTEFNPATDKKIKCCYDINSFENKLINKKALIEKTGLKVDAKKTPLIGMVSRLVDQKGLDLFKEIAQDVVKENVAFVFLGTGEPEYEEMLVALKEKYPEKIAAIIDYDDDTAHMIYAGSDAFLMPSRFEPCGISQMIAQRYGTLPIVRKTGGLSDTVKPYDKSTGIGTGFVFEDYSGDALYKCIKEALAALKSREIQNQLIRNTMELDNSFKKSAKKYLEMYSNIL